MIFNELLLFVNQSDDYLDEMSRRIRRQLLGAVLSKKRRLKVSLLVCIVGFNVMAQFGIRRELHPCTAIACIKKAYIFTTIFPLFLPSKRSINACGICLNPSTMVSVYVSFPALSQLDSCCIASGNLSA